MARLLHYGYYPLLTFGVNGAALAVVATGRSIGWLFVLLGFAIALSFGAERLLPYTEDWNRSHDDGVRDTLHAFVNEAANFSTLALLPVFTSLLALEGVWPRGWSLALQWLFAIVVLDTGIALAHFASHRWNWLWRFHAVHHSVKRMYGFNGLMKHPVHQAIETFAGTALLIVAGLPPDVATLLVFSVAIQLLLQHSNVDYTVGPFRRLLAVSEVHRFHHRKEAELGDVNFGLFTTLVDHALGTFHYEERSERFRSEELGIGAQPDYPAAYGAQLVEPFRSRSATGAAA